MPRRDIADAEKSDYTDCHDGYVQGRLKTFGDWKGEIPAEEIAKAGFICNGIKDQVVCPVCNLIVSSWKPYCKPMQIHVTFKPTCTFVQRNHQLSTESRKGAHADKHPQYSDFKNRLESFVSWPLTWVAHTPEMMARSGFFYTGSADVVTCFSCGVSLREWREDHCPPNRHRKFSGDCHFAASFDCEKMKKDIEELKNLMTDFDDYNSTEVFKQSASEIIFTAEGVRVDLFSEPSPKERSNTADVQGDFESVLGDPKSCSEQYSDYQKRLDSFKAWPLTWVAHTPEIMAKSGFFYIGSADRVTCFSCGVTLRDWQEDDFPPFQHRKYSEDCHFLDDLDYKMIKREKDEMEKLLNDYDDYNATEIFKPHSSTLINFTAEGVHGSVETGCQKCSQHLQSMESNCRQLITEGQQCDTERGPESPQFADYRTRLRSFSAWPLTTVAHSPEMMAKSGFYYIGSADRVRCFSCGITLRDWGEDDYPPVQHREYSEECRFLADLDIENIVEEIEELEKLLVEFDDYNFTEIFIPKSTVKPITSEQGVCLEFLKSKYVGCCPENVAEGPLICVTGVGETTHLDPIPQSDLRLS